MNEDCIAPDSSFYICFTHDLDNKEWVYELLNIYSAYAGKRILKEISEKLSKDDPLFSRIRTIDVDYYELVRPYFGRTEKHIDDGEYEAIGIAHYLYIKGCLKYLVLDDKKGKIFVKTHFPYLGDKLVGTIGFLRYGCCRDKKISVVHALKILNKIKDLAEFTKKRPCGIDNESYKTVLIYTIEKISNECKDG